MNKESRKAGNKLQTGLRILVPLFLLSLFVSFVFAAETAASTPARAPLEFLGVGPEMFADRGVAWVKAIAAVLKEIISELGLIALGIILMIKNVKAQTAVQEVKEQITDRLDRQGERIDKVALAAVPAATAAGTTPPPINIQHAAVEIQPAAAETAASTSADRPQGGGYNEREQT